MEIEIEDEIPTIRLYKIPKEILLLSNDRRIDFDILLEDPNDVEYSIENYEIKKKVKGW